MSEFEILTIQQGDRNFWLSVIVAFITFISVGLIYWDYKSRKNKERAEKSIQIAEEFAKNIIAPLSFIYTIFEQTKLDTLINHVNFMRFIDFDEEELKELYTDENISNYKKLLKENDPENKIQTIILNTLNRLEYMCMYIATGVADEKYIYNSLHQQFLKSIALLYFEISLRNFDAKDKYYTNIIHVYNLWKNKYIKAIKKEKRFKEKEKKFKEKQEKLKEKQRKKRKKLLLPNPKI